MQVDAYERVREQILAAVWRDLAPLEDEIERTGALSLERLLPLLREMGAFALLILPSFGGHGMTVTQYLPLMAELAKIHGGIRGVVHVHNSITHAFWRVADDDQRARVLPGAARGERSVAIALTEPLHGTGRDVGTTGRIEGDEIVVTGDKWLISNSNLASHFLVFARIESPGGPRPSCVLVERGRAGLRIEPMFDQLGCRGGQHGYLGLRAVRVPRANLLGGVGDGVALMDAALEVSRIYVAATSLGVAERCLELSAQYARERRTFGRPIASRQAVQRYLAEMAVDVYALRQMLADAAARADRGDPSRPRRRCASCSGWRRRRG